MFRAATMQRILQRFNFIGIYFIRLRRTLIFNILFSRSISLKRKLNGGVTQCNQHFCETIFKTAEVKHGYERTVTFPPSEFSGSIRKSKPENKTAYTLLHLSLCEDICRENPTSNFPLSPLKKKQKEREREEYVVGSTSL